MIYLWELLDARLVKTGDFDLIQGFRKSVASHCLKHGGDYCKEAFDDRLFRIFFMDYLARKADQAVERLSYQCQKFSKDTDSYQSDLEVYEKRLKEMEREGRVAELELYFCEAKLPSGPIRKAYHTLRQNPTWYLHPNLIEDCTRRGGCCGRSCGCCQKRLLKSQREGHCTFQCLCCNLTHNRGLAYDGGLPTPEQESYKLRKWFEPLRKGERVDNEIWRRMEHAYMFGTGRTSKH